MHQIKSISSHINSLYESMTKTEKKIAEYIVREPEKVIYQSITDLANEISVGEATIVRFCRKLGFQSFQSFKLTLGQDIVNSNVSETKELDVEIKSNDSTKEIIDKTYNINLCALQDTIHVLDENEVKRAIEAIVRAKKVFFCGAGVSEVTARDAAYRLMRIGLNTIALENHHFQRMQASLLTEEDVIIGVSHSGTTRDVYDILQIAKGGGAKVITITHSNNSPITKLADIVLLHGSRQNLLQGGALSSKMCQLMIIDILYNGIFLLMGALAEGNKTSTVKSILERLI